MTTNTAMQSIPVPEYTDAPNVPDHLLAVAQAVESRLVMRFTNSTDRDSRVPSPEAGMYCFVSDLVELQCYSGGWKPVWSAKSGANDTRWGQFLTYVTGSRPSAAGLQPGVVGANRTTGAMETVSATNTWQLAAARKVQSVVSTVYGTPYLLTNGVGELVTPNNNFTTSTANTTVNMRFQFKYGFALPSSGITFHQALGLTIRIAPPGGGMFPVDTQIIYFDGVSWHDNAWQYEVPVYTCAAVGAYAVSCHISIAGGGSDVAIARFDSIIEPVLASSAF